MIRLENNKVDKVLLEEYLKEISYVVSHIEGLDDINSYRTHFEAEFLKYIGSKYAIAVNSGTDALQLALLALGIGKGDTVIVPDLTYISSALTVKYVGAEPIFVDVNKSDLTLNVDLITQHIQKNTKAIIAVHMFGIPCAMSALKKISKKFNIYLIEDACQGLGSMYYKKNVGSFADIAAFSFSYYKPLSSLGGNGGMITFERDEYKPQIYNFLDLWKADIHLLKLERKFNKISLPDLASAKIKFKYMKHIIASREKIKKLYEAGLSKIKEVTIFKDPKDTISVRENYPILVHRRDQLYSFLQKNGIKTDLPYKPLHLLEIFKNNLRHRNAFSIAENYYKNGLHLPLYSFMTEKDCHKVIDSIRKFF